MVSLFALVVVCATGIGWFRFGLTKGFSRFHLPRPILIVALAVGLLQVIVSRLSQHFKDQYGYFVSTISSACITVCLILALAGIPLVRRGAVLVLVGWVMNATVILANRGMPVEAAAARWMDWDPARDRLSKHVTMTSMTRLRFLGDIFRVNLLVERTVISVGDVFLLAGFAVAIIQIFAGGAKPQARPRQEVNL